MRCETGETLLTVNGGRTVEPGDYLGSHGAPRVPEPLDLRTSTLRTLRVNRTVPYRTVRGALNRNPNMSQDRTFFLLLQFAIVTKPNRV
jgi:hypothetical protein